MTRVTSGKSRVRESCTPGSVRAKAEWLSYSTTTYRPGRKGPSGNQGPDGRRERGRWRSKRSYAGSGRTPPTRPLGIRGRPRRHDPGASASSLRRSPTRRIRRHRPSRATKAKIEVDAWKKFLQTRVFGLTLHHAGPSRPSDCKRPALRDRGTFRWGRHYARADRVAALRLRRRHRPIVAGGSPS